MASVTLDRVWLNDAADLDDSVSFYTQGRGDQQALSGSVRQYANGRARLITSASSSLSVPFTAVALEWADVQWLRDHIGRVVLFRDKPGRRVWGVYLSVDVDDRRKQESFDVKISLQRLSYDEAV